MTMTRMTKQLRLRLNDLDTHTVRTDDERDQHVLTERVRERAWLNLKLDTLTLDLLGSSPEVGKLPTEVVHRSTLRRRQLAFPKLRHEQPDGAVAKTVDAPFQAVPFAPEDIRLS